MNEQQTAAYERAYDSAEFRDLRRRLKRFVLPVSAGFLAWYLVYVLLATYAVGFMSIKVWGNINVGLLIGLGQFVTTFGITWWYVRFANRVVDPRARAIREAVEADLARGGGADPGSAAAEGRPA
ncbi:DUF485 domain-containing protein [Tsukamurella sp. 8F]|uniref:DUF485 domain-containing protein n=1 Tax=unclassified Tsukamurella TaxID=2633480 RepID=UPI0023B88DA7|nr:MULTISPECIES: DUF485 domain-containing protein [unclassified Tsukamurella]MDF0532125.1 DUF485 domain-containing protein [Tsukamurella sp. 8J]MDF0585166.1 DUF485 domain-containing protein [Tsukamurella sp. 8F]